MNTTATQYQYLAPNPKSSYKSLFVKGTRIRARVLYGWYASDDEPRTAEAVAADFNLPVEAMHEVIAYVESDPPEIALDYAVEEAISEACGMNEPDYKYHPSPKLLPPQERARIRREAEARFWEQWRAKQAE